MNVTVALLSKRFQQNHFERLVAALQLDTYTCHQRTVCSAAEALLILLRRLAYPNRWCELAKLFGRAEPELSMIFNEVCTTCLTDINTFTHVKKGVTRGMFRFAWLLLWDVKNERVTSGTSFSGPLVFFFFFFFLTYNTPRKNSGCVPVQFLFQFGSLQYKPFRNKGPFFSKGFEPGSDSRSCSVIVRVFFLLAFNWVVL